MLKQAMIVNKKTQWIFESETIQTFPPGPDGEVYLSVDLTDHPEVEEGWDYNPETGEFSEPEYIPPEPGPEPEPIPPTQLDIIESMIIENAIDTDFRFTMLEMSLGV